MKQLQDKIKESFSSVFPITLIVLMLSFTIAPLPIGTLLMFLSGAVLLVIGMGFFTLGADISMMPMGEGIGQTLTHTRKITYTIAITLLIGFIITLAEPDLQVLSRQVPAIPDNILIATVALGVGCFLAIGILRNYFHITLSKMLIFFYLIIFAFALVTPDNFLPVAFDSGGVTTGPVTVPFIMALGIGFATNEKNHEDSFGLISLSSIGPILAVLILGILYEPSIAHVTPVVIPDLDTSQDLIYTFLHALPEYMKEVSLALLPILLFFFIFQLLVKKFSRRSMIKIIIGMLYTYIGLVLFLTGVNVGFMPAGYFLGNKIASLSYKWILIPIGMLIGYFIVIAEPAVHVLTKQVEEISSGAICAKLMMRSLSIGVAFSLGIAMLRVLTGINIFYFLIPGYAIALILSFFVPKIYTAIAFDSGGVASGPMTAAFLLPFAMGAGEMLQADIMRDAFGIVAMVAMTPLITIQIVGFVTTLKHGNLSIAPGEDKILEE